MKHETEIVSPRRAAKQLMQDEVSKQALPRSIHLVPMDYLDGFSVRPGFYEINGATAIPGGVNFTVYSHGAHLLTNRPTQSALRHTPERSHWY